MVQTARKVCKLLIDRARIEEVEASRPPQSSPSFLLMLSSQKLHTLGSLSLDGRLLFATRVVRMAAYGALAVVLALYLAALGLSETQIGTLLSLTLVGDVVISAWIASVTDRVGRRRMLMLGAVLMVLAAAGFALARNSWLLTLAAVVGVISPSGAEVGPFLAIEQATLPQTAPPQQRTQVFAWYNLAGSLAAASGALLAGLLVATLQHAQIAPLTSYRAVVALYGLLGVVLLLLFYRLSPAAEVAPRDAGASDAPGAWLGLHRSRGIVLKLSALFALDAFAGALVVQSLIAYWFVVRFGADAALLGAIFFGANLLAGFSALAAVRVARRIGLVNTMVWTHIPSNLLLMLVPLMPTLPLAIGVLLARFSISQMDVPTRQSYIMAVVAPDERSAAAGFTTIVRTLASAASPAISGALLGASLLSAPFFLAGGLKILYDLALYRSFRAIRPPVEL
jgi:MFS family permease